MKRARLKPDFFQKGAPETAQKLLGKFLVRRLSSGREVSLMITEVEAYDGFKDRGSHAHRGQTPRNKPMFGHPGHWYVYFTYGMHWLINVVTGPKGYPSAVLIRGGIAKNKGGEPVHLNGPAKLSKFLGITGKFSGLAASARTGLWLEDRHLSRGRRSEGGIRIPAKKIRRGPRVGIDYAGKYWASRRWRFWIEV